MIGSQLAAVSAPERGLSLFEAVGPGRFCRVARGDEANAVELRVASDDGRGRIDVVWRWRGAQDDADMVLEWMAERPEEWRLWLRLVQLFGSDALSELVVHAAIAAGHLRRVDAQRQREAEAERERLHGEVDLFVLDDRRKRPGLALESGDESEPFFTMRFSERWERDRVVDWLRWQTDSFVAFRAIVEEQGDVALERKILTSMREFEVASRKRGITSGGRRPLRFWRGE